MIYLYKFSHPVMQAEELVTGWDDFLHYTPEYYTSHPEDLNLTSEPVPTRGPWLSTNIRHDGISLQGEKISDSIVLHISKDHPIAALFTLGYPPTALWLSVYAMEDPADLPLSVIWIGRLKTCQFTENEAIITGQPISDVIQKTGLVQRFQRQCGWALYQPGICNVNLARTVGTSPPVPVYERGITITGIDATGCVIDFTTATPEADGWYTNGMLSTGTQGQKRMVIHNVGNQVEILTPIDGLHVGQNVTIYKGCDHTRESCVAFGNIRNYGGFPLIPTANPFIRGL